MCLCCVGLCIANGFWLVIWSRLDWWPVCTVFPFKMRSNDELAHTTCIYIQIVWPTPNVYKQQTHLVNLYIQSFEGDFSIFQCIPATLALCQFGCMCDSGASVCVCSYDICFTSFRTVFRGSIKYTHVHRAL